jgi:uncharacterized membrane protein YqaE (UPF0057 family)
MSINQISDRGASKMDNKIILLILSLLLPPLAVFFKKGIGTELIISIILSLIFYVPGILYALWICVLKD